MLTAALHDNEMNIKALHRRAVAHEALGGWSHLNSALQGACVTYETADTRLPDTRQAEHGGIRAASILEGAARRAGAAAEGNRSRRRGRERANDGQTEGDWRFGAGYVRWVAALTVGYFGLSTDNFKMKKQDNGGYSLDFVK